MRDAHNIILYHNNVVNRVNSVFVAITLVLVNVSH